MRPHHAGLLRIATACVVAGLLLNTPGMAGAEWSHRSAAHGLLRTVRAPIGFRRPVSLAVDAHGIVYVADFSNFRVAKLSPAGKLLAAWPTGSVPAVGAAVDAGGRVYITSNSNIWIYSSTGTMIATWTVPVMHIGELEMRARLEGVALDPDGNAYTSDLMSGRISKFSSQGRLLAQWAVLKPRPVIDPTGGGVATDTQGHLYAVDKLNNRLLTLSLQGRVLAVWGQGGASTQRLLLPSGVAVDAHGIVYVGDSGHHRIVQFSPQGRMLAQWGTNGAGPAQFSGNVFVAVDQQGAVYVADDTNNTVQKFSSSGRLLAVWS